MGKRARVSHYKPDLFQETLRRFFGALSASGERVLYLLIAGGLALVVAAWFFTTHREQKNARLLDEIAAAARGDESAFNRLLEEHAGNPRIAGELLRAANVVFSEAQGAEEAAKRVALLEQAHHLYRLFVEKYPGHEFGFLARQGLGCVLEEQGRLADAVGEFRAALNAAPQTMKDKFSYDVGRVLVALGNSQEARPYLEDAVQGERVLGRPVEGDYQWRLNARQLLAELRDAEGADKVKHLAMPPQEASTPLAAEQPAEPPAAAGDAPEPAEAAPAE